MTPCTHESLKKQKVGDTIYWICPQCRQKFRDEAGEQPWDGKVRVIGES